jgi:glycosyltransferase involved in cell wall biosynthesis
MKTQLLAEFGVPESRVSVIRFGMNNTVPVTAMTAGEAKQRLGISKTDKALLFFGNIAAYKGLEYLIEAFAHLSEKCSAYRLIIAGKPKGADDYWPQLQGLINRCKARDRIIQRIEFVPDAQTELYFKAADVLVLPYTEIFQSGVLFLGYAFGLPVIATDVGSLSEDIIEGETGLMCKPKDAGELSKTIDEYFAHDLYTNLESRRSHIQRFADERYSWATVGQETCEVYSRLCVN